MRPSEYLKQRGYGAKSRTMPFGLNTVKSLMKTYSEYIAKEYSKWLSNQVREGRTSEKLWLDFEQEFFTK